MPSSGIDPPTLYWNVVHILDHGLRTATYKLATLMALIDFSVGRRPIPAGSALEVPLPDLARRVMALYWRQSRPFDGIQLLQSTQSRSRILDSLAAVRAAAGDADNELTLGAAAQLAPEVFRRAVDSVGLCLAQQPLPRLQRLPGSAKSATFLFDDTFLHDNVTRSELQRHNNAIRLLPDVADGLATMKEHLHRKLRTMWVDDVLRMNRLPQEKRQNLEEHLFEPFLPTVRDSSPQRRVDTASRAERNQPTQHKRLATLTFAARLNHLFETARSPDGQPYSSGEVAERIRQAGFPLYVGTVSQLRAGVGPAPNEHTIKALAIFFGVRPTYFSDVHVSAFDRSEPESRADEQSAHPQFEAPNSGSAPPSSLVGDLESPRKAPSRASTPEDADNSSSETRTGSQDVWGRVIGDDLNDVAAQCDIASNGCWLAPANSVLRCRARNDTRDPFDLPKISLHRWAWMVANGYSSTSSPSYLIQVRRRCASEACCNPSHLFAAAPGGDELEETEVAALLQKAYVGSTSKSRSAHVDMDDRPTRRGQSVLTDDLESIAEYCSIDDSGCWLAPSSSSVACRASGDHRHEGELPRMSPHRWAWMVSHGRSSNPPPGSLGAVWRNCGNSRCCNPDHLYLGDPGGQDSSVEEAQEPLHSSVIRQRDSIDRGSSQQSDDTNENGWRNTDSSRNMSQGGRHRASTSDGASSSSFDYSGRERSWDIKLFADRLNELFDSQLQTEGVHNTAAQVAATLQVDGFAVSESLISRLREASGDMPSAQTIEALAYFFNVDIDHFSAGTHSVAVKEPAPLARVHPSIDNESRPATSLIASPARRQVIPITDADLGRIVTGLSQAVSECLACSPADVERGGRLLLLLADLGALLSTPMDNRVISRPLLRRIVEEWTSVGHVTHVRHPILALLTKLVGEEPDLGVFR